MLASLNRFVGDESGATAIEYGLIAALVSVAAIVALITLGNSLERIFNVVATKLTEAADKAEGIT